jgi:hypothetical protein
MVLNLFIGIVVDAIQHQAKSEAEPSVDPQLGLVLARLDQIANELAELRQSRRDSRGT